MKTHSLTTSFLPLVSLLVLFSSCATYTMTPQQLYDQIHSATPKEVSTEHSMQIGSRTYTANGVKEIACTDKHGNAVTLTNSPSIEMKIKDKKNHRHIFYFDTINLQDSTFTGLNSRILGTRKSISYADIKTVEVQNGHKAYHYVDK